MRIVVLGMHRSGTSALTRLLAMMGCHLGADDEFNPAAPDNPTGYWERRDVWALNEEILSALGATWCDIGDLNLEQLGAERRAEFENRARKLIAGLERHRSWAIKDPRLCLLLPVWLPVLEQPICLVTHRRPIQIAQSLRRRNGFPLIVGLALWEKYTRAALRNSTGLARILVDHGRLIADPESAVRDLLHDLEQAGARGLRMPSGKQIREFIDPDLYRARQTLDDEEPLLTPGQKELARGLDDGSVLEGDPPPPAPGAIDEFLRDYFALQAARDRSESAAVQTKAARDAKAVRVEELAAQLEGTESRLKTADAELGEALRLQEAKAARVEELAVQLEQTENRLKATDAELGEALRLLEAKAARVEELAAELGEALRLREAKAAQLEEARTTIVLTESELARARQTCDELDHNLAATVHRAETLEVRLAAHEAELEGARRRIRLIEDELRTGLTYADELQALIDLVLGSGRWRLANRAGEFARRISLRPKQPEAGEIRDRMVAEVDAWRDRLRRDLGIPSGD